MEDNLKFDVMITKHFIITKHYEFQDELNIL